MKRVARFANPLMLMVLLLLVTASVPTLAASTPAYSIGRFTIDGGGGRSTGGAYTLNGSIGQFDANPQNATGANYSVRGGFWARLVDVLFKDGFEALD